MAKLVEIREQLRVFYGKYEVYIRPALRFLIAIIVFFSINGNIGYMRQLSNPAVSIILALICTFLPANATLVMGALVIVVHLLSLSPEVGLVGFLLFVLMFFMYFKYAPKSGYSAILTALLSRFGISQSVPVTLGLIKTPFSAISMVCGLITYYFLNGVRENEAILGAIDDNGETSKLATVMQIVVENKELYLVIASFVLTTIVVYVIRRQSIDRAWTIAVVIGNAINLIVLVCGSIILDAFGDILWIIIGTAVSVIVGLSVQFFVFHLDYARTERVQFEDDEYFYYVKAVPKIYVSGTEKQVKQINSRKENVINKRELANEFDINEELLDD